MDNNLIIRFIERQCTLDEAREVLRWIEASEENKAVFRNMQAVYASISIDSADRTGNVDAEDVQQIMKEISRKRYRLATYIGAAVCSAAVILFVVLFPFTCDFAIYSPCFKTTRYGVLFGRMGVRIYPK